MSEVFPSYERISSHAVEGRASGHGREIAEGLLEVMDYIDGLVTSYFVDVTNGDDSYDGLTWDKAFETIQAAMDAAAALGVRGRAHINVAPGEYEEDVVTPLNTECPFGILRAINPTGKSFGAAYIYAETVGGPTLTIRARGWRIEGFEIGAVANAEAIVLDGLNTDCNAAGTHISNCLISGWGAAGTIGIDVLGNGAPGTIITNCRFDNIVGSALVCTNSGTDSPRFWEIAYCVFTDNGNHLNLSGGGGRGFKESWLHDNVFNRVGANRTATYVLYNLNGNNNAIGPNNIFSDEIGEIGGVYLNATDKVEGNAAPGEHSPVRTYYVDGTNGDDNYSGRTWGAAFATIQAAMDAITARGYLRGSSEVHVAPGGYTENVVTPLNSIAPFGKLIAVNPTVRSFGAAWIFADTVTLPALTIRARGWLVDGFEIAGAGSGGAILLDGLTANCNPAGAAIVNCLIGGWNVGEFGINVIGNGAPLTTIRNCHFGGINGPAMQCTESGTDQPTYWEIDHCTFANNSAHISMNPRGFRSSWIHDCSFIEYGADFVATEQLDNRGGTYCNIGPGNFFSDTYDHAGGYRAGTNEFWRGNLTEDTVETVTGGEGTASANPAA